MRILALIFGSILACYGSAGILSDTIWHNSEPADRVLCRVQLCTNSLLVASGRQFLDLGGDDTPKAIAAFRTVVIREPQDAYAWADLGEAYFEAGQKENARYCYGRVLALAPRAAPLLLRVANFHFGIGENQEALPITAKILSLVPDYDGVIFGEYVRLVEHVDEVLYCGLPPSGRAAKSWLRFLMNAGRLDDARRSWQWTAERGYAEDVLAGEYTDFLLRQGNPGGAASAWSTYLGRRAGDYGKSNCLFNGSFESEPVPAPFDWNLARTEGVEVARDFSTSCSGRCSLRLSFDGTQNLAFTAASQLAVVQPGRYHFRAYVRTENLTTDQGIRFRVSDAEAPGRLDVTFGQFTGNNPWTGLEHDIVVPPATRILRVQVIREASTKFDNKIGGTAWIDDLRFEPNPHLNSS
jgi:hypothetical protein